MNRRDEGSIFKYKDGKRWVARIQYTNAAGVRTAKQKAVATYDKAKAALKDLRRDIEREFSDRKRFVDLDSFYRREYVHAAKFVGGKKISGFRQSVDTVEKYMDAAKEYFGDTYLDEITFEDLRRFKQSIADKPTRHGRQRSVSDTNHHLKRLRRLFAVAVEQGWLEKNPFNRGSRLIIEAFETERTRVLTAEEEKKLLAACNRWRKHLAPIVIVAIETGLRRGELMSLRWSSVDLGRRQLRVDSLNSKTLKSRIVPLSSRAIATLAELRRNARGRISDLVFGNSDFKKAFIGACEEAKLSDLHFHDLRHTAITRWLEKGISPALAMKASGHSQMRTFLRYVNQSSDSVMEFAAKLDRAA